MKNFLAVVYNRSATTQATTSKSLKTHLFVHRAAAIWLYAEMTINSWDAQISLCAFTQSKCNWPRRSIQMNIVSLSVLAPATACINDCEFCVVKPCCYEIYLEEPDDIFCLSSNGDNEQYFTDDLEVEDYAKRLEFARDFGCNSIVITGRVEPQQERDFLEKFGQINNSLRNPFRLIELQTTGVMIDSEYLLFLRFKVGVNTISISLSSFDNVRNKEYIKFPGKHEVHLVQLCKSIREHGFNLRLSVVLTDAFNGFSRKPEAFFKTCGEYFRADQVALK